MPFYEYRCNACGHAFEAMQKMSDAPLTDCPNCGKPELTKLISAAGFRLKGGGWYETDFKKGRQKNLHDSGGQGDAAKAGDKPDGGKKEAAKSDSGKADSGKSTGKGSGASAPN